MKKTLSILLLLFSVTARGGAESKISIFKPVNYANYLHGSVRANYSYLETGFINQFSPYYYLEKENPYPVVSAKFSFDVPILSAKQNNSAWGIDLPIQNSIIIDMYENCSAPVLNNDYIFGVTFKYYRPLDHNILKTISVRATPFFHESTHIGDEFAIHGIKNIPHFTRINVSYEAWELYILMNDPYNIPKGNLTSFGFGISGLFSPKKGYYAYDSIEIKSQNIFPSERYMEYFFGTSVRRQEGFLCSEKWTNILSIELSNRVQYNYYMTGKENRLWNINVLAGYQFTPSVREKWITNTGFYLRYYYGLNPHGMFRSHADYQFIGIASIFSMN